MKRVYERPLMAAELFVANEYVAACYALACQVGDYGEEPPQGFNWGATEKGNVTHSKSGTSGTCADELANRIVTDSNGVITSIQEHNSQQGWLDGALDSWQDLNDNGKCDDGDLIYWHTVSGNNDRRWNHWGYAKNVDDSHPNHS